VISALDTHETVKRLTAAGFTDAQAEALTAAVKNAVDIDLSKLATKTDIADLRHATKTDIADLRHATETDIADLRHETKIDIADLRREMAEIKAELVKWVVGMGFAQVAMILAVLKLFPTAHP
jgi:hypothetical protein